MNYSSNHLLDLLLSSNPSSGSAWRSSPITRLTHLCTRRFTPPYHSTLFFYYQKRNISTQLRTEKKTNNFLINAHKNKKALIKAVQRHEMIIIKQQIGHKVCWSVFEIWKTSTPQKSIQAQRTHKTDSRVWSKKAILTGAREERGVCG